MGLFPTRQLSRLFRRSGTPSSSGTRYPSIPTYSPRGNLLPTTSNNPGVPLCTACSIPLTFLAGATVILFVFTCWLATTENLHSIYPTSHHNFRNSIDDHDSLGIILRPRESSIYYGQQQIFELEEHEGGEKGVEKEIVRPEITQEVKEAESRSKSRLWFKAEYTIEIPVCEGGLAVQSGGACIHKDGSRNGRRGGENNPIWVPATESVRVSFCTGYSSEEADDSGDGWEEERSWDYVYPPKNGPSGVHTAPEWIYRVDKRPLEKWRSVDVSGRKHDVSFSPHLQNILCGSGAYCLRVDILQNRDEIAYPRQ